jgi:hypothetical protein
MPATDRSATPFLPRTANTHHTLDPAGVQKRAHLGTEFPVTIKDDVTVRAWKRERLSELLHDPVASRVRRRFEVQNAAAMMFDDEEAIEYAKSQRGHREEVECGDHFAVILEERQPALYLGLVGLALKPPQRTACIAKRPQPL